MNIAQRLEALIKERNVSRSRLARELGVHTSTVSNWLSGKDVKTENLQAICEYFQKPMDYFIGEQEKPADQVAGGLEKETIDIAEKIRKATPELRKLIYAALEGDGDIRADIKKIKVTCPIDGTEQVIYQPVYKIGSLMIPDSGNNGCELCHPCNECTICRLKAVSSALPDLDT